MKLSRKDLERLKNEGKIRDYRVNVLKPVTVDVGGGKVVKPFTRKSKEKDWFYFNVLYLANKHGWVVSEEYVFHEVRKWRFDLFLQFTGAHRGIGLEFEGINSEKSRHTSLIGYSGDADKYREANKMGITVFRYTILNYKKVISDLTEAYEILQKM